MGELYPRHEKQTKNPAETTGNRYKIEILMSRTQKLKGLAAASLILKTLNDNPYILWIKYGISSEVTKQFQIRSFYKCTEQRDIIKFDGLTKTHIRENLYAYVNKTINKNGNHQES